MFGCSGCRREHSVTAGTFLHAAKLSLTAIARYVVAHQEPLPPSARALSRAFDHRRETAWSWSMRVKSAIANLSCTIHALPCATFRRLPLRPPHPASPAPHPAADPAARDACDPHRDVVVAFLSDAVGLTAFLPATSPMRVAQELRVPEVWHLSDEANEGLADHAVRLVLGVHRTVSERWLPRYLGFAAHQARTEPWRALLQAAPSAFARLRPAGAPAPALDDRHRPRHRTSPDLVALCRALRALRPLDPRQLKLRTSLRPAGHPVPLDASTPTRRR